MQTPTLIKSAPGFHSWSFYNPEVKCECSSHVFVHDQSLILIDPTPLPEALEADLKKLGSPTAILLTNGNHARAAQDLKKRWTVPIGAGAGAVEELDFIPEMIVDSLKQIHGLTPYPLNGAGAGEFSYYCAKTKTLVVGDALTNLDSAGLAVLPEKYCIDPSVLKISLTAILKLDFENLLMAHGEPIIGSARAKLQALLKK